MSEQVKRYYVDCNNLVSVVSPRDDCDVLVVLASDYATLQAECARLKALSVENIMLDIVPGDGSGREVYATSVADVEGKLSQLADLEDEVDNLKAERERLRGQVAALQSSENSYQSGFETGRKSVHAHAQSWRKACEQAKAELAAIKAQEPVARAHKGDYAFFVTWTESGKPLRGVIDLYALPAVNPQLTTEPE